MVYRDNPYSPADDGGGVEITQYRDVPSDSDAGEYDIATQPVQSTSGRSLCCRILLAVCFLSAVAVGGWEYSGYSQGDSGSNSSNSVSVPEESGSKGLFPKKVGVRGISRSNDQEGNDSVRGISSSNDQEGNDSADHETVVENNAGGSSSVDDDDGKQNTSNGNHNEVGAPATPEADFPKKPPKPTPTNESPQTDECEDDPTFVHVNLKSCGNFVTNVGRPMLRNARCNQATEIIDENGDELRVKHFCRKACGMCDEKGIAEREKNEYVQELKELEKKEEEGIVDEEGSEGSADEGEVTEEDSELWEELKEEENGSEDESTQDSEVSGDVDAGESGDESNTVDNEPSGEEVHEGGDFVSEGKSHEPPAGDEDTAPRLPPDETFEDQVEGLPDYFVPLTVLERDALKERLRRILKLTKDSLVMTNTLKSIPEETRDMMRVAWQRTLVLSRTSPKQFMHLQHHQTGSESIDTLISCALDRQNELHGGPITHSAISEDDNMEMCMHELASRLGATVMDDKFYRNDQEGNPIAESMFDPADEKLHIPDDARNACGTSEAHVMSFDASLNAVRTFGWQGVDSIAMFANPVERLHRMYQLTAKQCYGCQKLTDVLRQIKSGTFRNEQAQSTIYSPHDSCAGQMIGHQATNLLSSPDLYNVANDVSFPREREIVNEAVRNLREGITWIGLLDQMEDSVVGFKEVFPWLSENLNGIVKSLEQELLKGGDNIGKDVDFALPVDYIDRNSCIFEEQNVDLFTCGSRGIDADTLQLIKELNMRDLAVYKAAVERLELQKEVIREYRQALRLD